MSGHDRVKEKYVETKLSLAEFMQQNLERDPDFFTEPENTPDYGPPGMPTPFVPMDARIAERQLNLSDSLRGLLLNPALREYLGEDTIEMLKMNFDSHNTILGVTNNGSYYRWTHQENRPTLPAELQAIEEKAVLGVAQPGEILDLLLHQDDQGQVEDLKSAELMKIYHPAKYRMRHLEPRRQQIKQAILDRGGMIIEKPDFYDLKLFPYVVVTERELTDEERRECYLLQKSAEMKLKILNAEKTKNDDGTNEDAVTLTPELIDEIIAEIHRAGHRVNEILAGTQIHTIKGLMASVKRRIGVIEKNDTHDLRIVERQVFAVDIADFDEELMEAIHNVRAERDERDKNHDGESNKKPVIDETTVAVYERVYAEFKKSTDTIIPVSTAAFAYEKPRETRPSDTVTGAIAKIATRSTVSVS
jgi:hypothetical protein